MYRTLRIELILPLTESTELVAGSLVNARLNDNSNSETATLVHIGSYEECDVKRDAVVKESLKCIPDAKSNKKATKYTREHLAIENSDLKSKLQKLSNQFDNLQSQYQETRDTIAEKDREINDLKIHIEVLEEKVQLSTNNELLIDPIQHSLFSQFGGEIAGIKSCVAIILEKINEITSNPSSGLTGEKVLMAKGSTILVSRNRFVNAGGTKAKSVTSFVRKIFTAVFEYDEVMDATLTGLSRSGTKRKNFENENSQCGSNSSTPIRSAKTRMSNGKSLPARKVTQFIESVQELYHDAAAVKIRSQITFKLSKINAGQPTKNDLIDWPGFNEQDYKSRFGSVNFQDDDESMDSNTSSPKS